MRKIVLLSMASSLAFACTVTSDGEPDSLAPEGAETRRIDELDLEEYVVLEPDALPDRTIDVLDEDGLATPITLEELADGEVLLVPKDADALRDPPEPHTVDTGPEAAESEAIDAIDELSGDVDPAETCACSYTRSYKVPTGKTYKVWHCGSGGPYTLCWYTVHTQVHEIECHNSCQACGTEVCTNLSTGQFVSAPSQDPYFEGWLPCNSMNQC